MQSGIGHLRGEPVDVVEQGPRRRRIQQHDLGHGRPWGDLDGLPGRGAVRLAAQFTERDQLGLPDTDHSRRNRAKVTDRHRGQMLAALQAQSHLIGSVEGGETQVRCGPRRHQEAHQPDPLRSRFG